MCLRLHACACACTHVPAPAHVPTPARMCLRLHACAYVCTHVPAPAHVPTQHCARTCAYHLVERPSGLTIISPILVTFASSEIFTELATHVLPPSLERAELAT